MLKKSRIPTIILCKELKLGMHSANRKKKYCKLFSIIYNYKPLYVEFHFISKQMEQQEAKCRFYGFNPM